MYEKTNHFIIGLSKEKHLRKDLKHYEKDTGTKKKSCYHICHYGYIGVWIINYYFCNNATLSNPNWFNYKFRIYASRIHRLPGGLIPTPYNFPETDPETRLYGLL